MGNGDCDNGDGGEGDGGVSGAALKVALVA